MNSSARLIDLIAFQLAMPFFVVLMKNATANTAGIKFTCYKMRGCLGSNGIT